MTCTVLQMWENRKKKKQLSLCFTLLVLQTVCVQAGQPGQPRAVHAGIQRRREGVVGQGYRGGHRRVRPIQRRCGIIRIPHQLWGQLPVSRLLYFDDVANIVEARLKKEINSDHLMSVLYFLNDVHMDQSRQYTVEPRYKEVGYNKPLL